MNDVGTGPQTAQRAADALFEHFQIERALAGERVLIHPSPQPLIGVEHGSVSRETIDAPAEVVSGQGCPSHFRAMGIETVPEQKARAGNAAQEMADESADARAGEGAAHQPKAGVGVPGDGRDGRQLRPIAAAAEQGRLTARGPGPARAGQQAAAALAEKDQRGRQPSGVSFRPGQASSTQRRMAGSTRSRARRAGFCQPQPNRCSRRHT
jgi:hypothetical protein